MTVQPASPAVARRLQLILQSIDRIRPLSTSVTRVLNALSSDTAGAGMIAELLGLDPALAANVLQAANSAYLGYGPTCTNLQEAVMRLGFARIRTITMGVAASGSLNHSLPGYRLATGDLWNHSVSVAMAAQWFARSLGFNNPEDAYVAGLLHDIGKVVLDQFVMMDYNRLYEYAFNNRVSFSKAETMVFSIDHGKVGGLMAKKWNFPMALIEAIGGHHQPWMVESQPRLAAVIHIANALAPMDPAMMNRLGPRELLPEALEILNLPAEKLERLRVSMVNFLTGGG
ncbi:MAG TPA: HDOD domain-containing protein [Anaerolineaceae bacterium]|nr:HDOD domain-containing protein [Anaerolineaceae bacterium]HPN52813.1 HDOD domain-containing protein [Anaerolineaceae bacterium]